MWEVPQGSGTQKGHICSAVWTVGRGGGVAFQQKTLNINQKATAASHACPPVNMVLAKVWVSRQGARDSAQAHYASGVAGLMPVKWSLPEGQEGRSGRSGRSGQEGFWSRQSWAFRVKFLWGQRKGEDGQIMGPQASSIRKTYSDCLALKPHHGV